MDTPIKITTNGKRHLGATIGTNGFKNDYMQEKVSEWCSKLKVLSKMAHSNPQTAYAAYIFGEQHKYTYFMRTIQGISDILKPIDDVMDNEFIPALFGSNITPNEREIISLPIREGGLGLGVQHKNSDACYAVSKAITEPLMKQIISQDQQLPSCEEVKQARSAGAQMIQRQLEEKINNVQMNQTPTMKRNLEQLALPGASSWLSALPLKEQGFNLNKSEFQDALNIRYDRVLKNLPSKCACDKKFDLTHAMNCTRGGFISNRHDSIRNFEAKLLKQVCNDVQVEPALQPIPEGRQFHSSANTRNDARLDVRAKGFWREGQNAFFDVRVTNADSTSQRDKSIESILKSHEQEKKRKYNVRVMEIDQGSFTPIVLTVKGVIGSEANVYHKILAQKIATKSGEQYEDITRLIRVKTSFLVLRAALLCLRGSRVVYTRNSESCDDFAFTLNEIGL